MSGWNGGTGWHKVRRPSKGPDGLGGWGATDVVLLVVALLIHWQVAVAFIGLKLWQQASGDRGSVFAFARDRWDTLVTTTRSLLSGASLPSFSAGPRSSGNVAFDRWRQGELARIEGEREQLRVAEREFATFRDEQSKDHEDFGRFMQAREGGHSSEQPANSLRQ